MTTAGISAGPPVPARAIVGIVLEVHGETFADALGIDLGRGGATALFQWLVASMLFAKRIRAAVALRAAAALFRQGWTTPEALAAATWEDRTFVLNQAGYARYDESTSRRLADMAQALRTAYGGDLRRLRRAARREPEEERRLLKAFKGIGDVAVDIFWREVQGVWRELYPFADRRALAAARALGLGDDAASLAGLVTPAAFPRLVAALVRTDLAGDAQQILERAASPSLRSRHP